MSPLDNKGTEQVQVPIPTLQGNSGDNGGNSTASDAVLKLIFLDIDGVLNSSRTNVAFGGNPERYNDYDDGPMVKWPHFNDNTAANLVNKLCASTGAYIVLSSSWRKGLTGDQVRKMLGELNINPNYVLGRTCDPIVGGSRCAEIDHFCRMMDGDEELQPKLLTTALELDLPITVGPRVILDDQDPYEDDEGDTDDCHWEFVNGLEGLMLRNVLNSGKFLLGTNSFYLTNLKEGLKYNIKSWRN